MSTTWDPEYLSERAAVERRISEQTNDRRVSSVHAKLAKLYEEQARRHRLERST
jgi:hypothetical protein